MRITIITPWMVCDWRELVLKYEVCVCFKFVPGVLSALNVEVCACLHGGFSSSQILRSLVPLLAFDGSIAPCAPPMVHDLYFLHYVLCCSYINISWFCWCFQSVNLLPFGSRLFMRQSKIFEDVNTA